MTIRRRRSTRSARTFRPSSPEIRTWGSTSSPGTSIAMARSTDSNGLSDRPSAWAATRLRRAEPGPRAAAAMRGAGRPGSRRAAPSQRRPAPRRTAVAVRTSRASSSRSWRAPRPASSSRSVHVNVMRVRRASSIRRSFGYGDLGHGGNDLDLPAVGEGGRDQAHVARHHEGELGALVDAGHGVPAPVDPHELAGLERRLERSSRGQAHQQVARRHAAEDRHQVRDLHPPSVVQCQADRIVLHRSVVRTERTHAEPALAGGPALAGRSVRSTVRAGARSRGRGCGSRSSPS